MDDTTKNTRARSRKPAVKKEVSNSADTKALEKAVASLTNRCDALEARCAKLENAKTPKASGSNDISEARWESLKLFLEKKFGRDWLKRTGMWEL